MTNEELVQEYQNGNHQALDELMQENTGLVMYFANKYYGLCYNTSLDFDDLVQEGWIGLIYAAKKYDPDIPTKNQVDKQIELNEEAPKAVQFSTFAGIQVKGRMLNAIRDKKPRKVKCDLESEVIVNSVNAFLPGSDDTTLEEMLPDEQSMECFKEIEEDFDNKLLRKDLIQLLDSVFGSEFRFNGIDFNGVNNIKSLFYKVRDGINAKEVLLLHYGLFGKEMSYREIGKLVGLTGSRIEQIEYRGIKRIRKSKQGKEFMTKYEVDYVDELLFRKEQINKFKSPERILDGIESIDNLLKQYI